MPISFAIFSEFFNSFLENKGEEIVNAAVSIPASIAAFATRQLSFPPENNTATFLLLFINPTKLK